MTQPSTLQPRSRTIVALATAMRPRVICTGLGLVACVTICVATILVNSAARSFGVAVSGRGPATNDGSSAQVAALSALPVEHQGYVDVPVAVAVPATSPQARDSWDRVAVTAPTQSRHVLDRWWLDEAQAAPTPALSVQMSAHADTQAQLMAAADSPQNGGQQRVEFIFTQEDGSSEALTCVAPPDQADHAGDRVTAFGSRCK